MSTQTNSSILETVAAEFNFGVNRFPLSFDGKQVKGFYALLRDDTQEPVHDKSVSADYQPHTTDDVLALVESAQDVFGECSPRCHFRKGHYVDLAPTKDERIAIYGTKDNIFPRLQISAGYNGTSFHFSLGWFRDLCRNMSMLRSVRGTSVSFRHNGNLRDNLEQLKSQLTGLREGWETLGETVQRMESSRTSLASFLTSIYGEPTELTGSALTRHTNRTETIMRRVLDEQARSGRPAFNMGSEDVSVWEAYNAVQGFTQHKKSVRGAATTMFDRELKAVESPEVKAAERLALTLSA